FIKCDQPMIPGYVMIHSEKELGVLNRNIRSMSQSSFGLLKYSDGSFELKGKDLEYAAWVFSFEGRITASKVKIIKNIKEGDTIVVVSGPLKDFKGKIIKLNKNSRVLVEVDFLGDVKTINLPIDIVSIDHSVEKSGQSATQIINEGN
ncbi:MAG: KOW motif-containing protein, partial [Sphaerochaetaceae bacterium]|nr:KOW motif-containing protein [Sphaerochaetaceae bacterium]